MKNIHKIDDNIYITNDEEIKEGDWFIANNGVHKCIRVDNNTSCPFITLNSKGEEIGHFKTWRTKIILTTDQDLIKDGVQAIGDEFLEWFINNPSCERVEVGYGWIRLTETDNEGYWVSIPNKQFEMQQEEPKQEHILEEAAEKYSSISFKKQDLYDGFIAGASWQQEQILQFLYSEITERRPYSSSKMCEEVIKFIEQFKKK